MPGLSSLFICLLCQHVGFSGMARAGVWLSATVPFGFH